MFYFSLSINKLLVIVGYLPKEKVASFKFPDKFFKKYKKNILGLHANLWTEYMNTEEKMDYMLYPRLNAFSEVVNK